MTLQRLLRIAGLVFLILTAAGLGTVHLGSIGLSLLGAGLACWLASEL